jgi:hypothetical protein
MKTYPINPNIMRHYALFLRDVLSDDINANHLLHEADQIEEDDILLH